MHALFGRRFRCLSISTAPTAVGYADVIYQGHMRLRILLSSTQLSLPRNYVGSKLTLESVTELVALARQCDALCQSLPTSSGTVCPLPSRTPLPKT